MRTVQTIVDTSYDWAELHRQLDVAIALGNKRQKIRRWLFDTERAYPTRYVRLEQLMVYCKDVDARWYLEWLMELEVDS